MNQTALQCKPQALGEVSRGNSLSGCRPSAEVPSAVVPLGLPSVRSTRSRRELKSEQLQIAGLVPLSTVDWPGKLVATVFCQGCPWACTYCHNYEILPMRTPGAVPWENVSNLLLRRRGLLDGVVFSGGEATRQRALIPAMREVREAGFLVGLHTAGAYPQILQEVLQEDLVDWVGIDIKATAENYPAVVGRPGSGTKAWQALDEVVAAQIDHEVRLTVFPDGPEDSYEVAQRVKHSGAKFFALQQARAEGAPKEFRSAGLGWDEQCADLAKEISELGFENFTYRAA